MEDIDGEEGFGAPPQSGGSSSENGTSRPRIERLKLEDKPDRISDLPDSLIQHILSFLPSTKEAIQTGILSKRWLNQWTRVPVLIFDSTGMSDTNFSQFIDTTLTLHDCSKISKFHIKYYCNLNDPHLTSKVRFATRKNVEELMLHLNPHDENGQILYELPKFLFDNASLGKLELFRCSIGDNESTNWSSLKELKLECSFVSSLAIGNVVSGCPLLESLELSGIIGFHNVVIASKSLEKFYLQSNKLVYIWDLEGWRKKKYRNSNETVFKCSVSNLKTVKIVGLSEMDESPHKCLFNFVEFLLKNARMLEKISIILAENCGTGFLFEVSKKFISFQRCFPHTTIELLRSN